MAPANEKQWSDFWQRLKAKGDASSVWQRLAASYSEEWRKYHNLTHIGHCLKEFQGVTQLAKEPLAVEAAIWFHDAVYDTRRKDNEEQSAELAVEVLRGAGMSESLCETVRQLVLATKHAKAAEGDAALLTDIDLAILGQDETRYAGFEKEIREEYAWVSATDFAKGRSAVLKGFLARERIYARRYFVEKYEKAARRNLEWAIGRLGG